jgi:hypothetical protein
VAGLKINLAYHGRSSPTILDEMLQSTASVKTERMTNAYLKLKKFDIAALKQAFEGN